MSTSILNKANNFIKYFKSLNKIEIDEKLIYEYYILTADKYTSHYDAYMWLGQTKKSLSQNLQSNYVLDTNYWIVPYETEKLYVKLYLDTFDYEKERKYYLHWLLRHLHYNPCLHSPSLYKVLQNLHPDSARHIHYLLLELRSYPRTTGHRLQNSYLPGMTSSICRLQDLPLMAD